MKSSPVADPLRTLVACLCLGALGTMAAVPPASPRLDPGLRTLLGRMLDVYAQTATYRDDGRITILQQSGRVRNITKMPSSIAFARPNRLQVISGAQTIASDGRQLQIVLDVFRQYQQREAPARLAMDDVRIGAPGAGLEEGFPEILEFLLGEKVLERWLAALTRIERLNPAAPVQIAGKSCDAVEIETRQKARITLFIEQERGVLLRCDMDFTAAQQPAGASPPAGGEAPATLQYAYQLDPVVLDEPTPDSLFALRELSGMRLVTQFSPPSPDGDGGGDDEPPDESDGSRLSVATRRTAIPGFQATDVSGRTVSRDHLTGKVALLFLWTPQGSGESLTSIRLVQQVADAFTDRTDFYPLGITLATDDTDLVKGLLAAKRASFPTVLDRDGTWTSALRISTLPTFCLVSRAGEIAEVFNGIPQGGEAALKSRIEELLRAEN